MNANFIRKQLLPTLICTYLWMGCSHLKYPSHWFEPVLDPNPPEWEILPQAAKPGEVILSKRNELGILSNFAHTPFQYRGVTYQSIEGFWQMMLYPEDQQDPRATSKKVKWKHTRAQVSKMVAFEAKLAGSEAEKNMKTLGIDWCTFEGERLIYRSLTRGRHYQLIREAMIEKLKQNPRVKEVLLSTGNLILRPDHHPEAESPDEWKYYEIWMDLRDELLRESRT